MKRRKLLKTAGAVALPVAVAGCGSNLPDKQCEGHCELLEEWSWDWEDNGALNPSALHITFIPQENAPTLEIEVKGYHTGGAGEPDLQYANTYTVKGSRTIIEEQVEPVHAIKIEVTATND